MTLEHSPSLKEKRQVNIVWLGILSGSYKHWLPIGDLFCWYWHCSSIKRLGNSLSFEHMKRAAYTEHPQTKTILEWLK